MKNRFRILAFFCFLLAQPFNVWSVDDPFSSHIREDDRHWRGQKIWPQVIYRFDAWRYIVLDRGKLGRHGRAPRYCSGVMWYLDTQRDIVSRIGDLKLNEWTTPETERSGRVPYGQVAPASFRYFHAAQQYVVVPRTGLPQKMADGQFHFRLYGFNVSADHGKTWMFTPIRLPRLADERPQEEMAMTVINNQIYLQLKEGYLVSSDLSRGSNWSFYDNQRQNNPPQIDEYPGWDGMRCSATAQLSEQERREWDDARARVLSAVTP